jgi:hypothetical protein
VRPYLKKDESKRTGGVAQVVESLPMKCKALTLISSTTKSLIIDVYTCERNTQESQLIVFLRDLL